MEKIQQEGNLTTLTILTYPGWAIPFAFFAMAIFRIPLLLNRKISFWRLMGTGKNGTFDMVPDVRKWAIMAVHLPESYHALLSSKVQKDIIRFAYGNFILSWIMLFTKKQETFILNPIESHGLWNQKKVFGNLPVKTDYEGQIAVMTRATIRLSKLKRFWSHVNAAAGEMANAPGFIKSYGVGEWPFVKQATFSIWESKEAMKNFAYQSVHHKDIIKKTHAEKWYSEDMFTRFKIILELNHN